MNENENAILVNGLDVSGRKLAEEKLFESEKLYRSLFENMLNGFAYCQMHVDDKGMPVDFTYLSVNSAFETLTGLKNVVGKKVTEIIPGIRESDPELFEVYGRVSKTGKPERFEMFVDALQMWFSISVYSPERGYFVAVFDVITARKKAEEKIRTAHDKIQLLLDSIAEGAYGVDLDGNCTFVNRSFLHLLGYQHASELIGKQIHLLIHHSYADGNNYPASECKMLNTRLTKQKINVSDEVFWRKDGVAIPVEYWSYPIIKEDKVIGSICTFIDITERKQAEEVIRESERLLNEAQHLAKLGNWYFDLISGEVGWSKTLYEINKRDPKLPPPKYGELVSCYTKESWERLSRAVEKAIKDGTSYELELDIIRADGKIIQTHTYGKAVKDKSGRVIQLHGTVQDITERKQAEESIKESEKKFRLLYNETPVMMHSINQQGELLSVSDFWLEKLGYQR